MNRLLTLASTGLFAAGLAILPVSVYAATSGDTNAPGTNAPVTASVGKVAPVVKGDTAAKDAAKPAPTGTAKAGTALTGTAKVGSTQTPAHSAPPAKVGG